MEATNKYLILSLQQDLNELNRTSQAILDDCQMDHFSWLYPTKTSADVLNITGNGSTLYVRYLELIIDRLYCILTYFNKTLCNTAISNYRPTKNISTTKLTLGHVTTQVFKQILSVAASKKGSLKTRVSQENSVSKLNNNDIGIVNVQTQTDQYSTDACDTCKMSMMCIKNILASIENVNCSVAKTRKDIRENLYEITQTDCMNKIIHTIENAIDTLCDDFATAKLQAENYKLDLDKEKCASQIYEKRIDTLRIHLENGQEKVNKLEAMNHTLQQNQKEYLSTIGSLKVEVENLRNQASEHAEKYRASNAEKEILEITLQGSRNTCDILYSEIELWRRRFEDVNAKQEYIRIKTEQLVYQMQSLQDKTESLNGNLLAAIAERNKKIADQRTGCKVTIEEDNLPKRIVGVEGNPAEDMKKQIDINKKEIKQLEHKNHKLLKVISKLENMNCVCK